MPKHIIDTGNQSLSGGLTLTGELSAQTVSINSSALVAEGTTWTYGTGAADTHLTALGGGTAGKAIFGAATYTGTGSVRELAGLDTTNNVRFNNLYLTNALFPGNSNNVRIDSDGSQIYVRSSSVPAWHSVRFGSFVSGANYSLAWCNISNNASAGTVDTHISRASAGVVRIGTAINNNSGSMQLANLTASGTVSAGTYTYAQLTALTPATGSRAFCSDSDTAASGNFASTFAGTGANFVPCYYDGSNWRIG